jgi:hypothetical protein
MNRKSILVLGGLAVVLVTTIGLPFGAFGLDSRITAAYVGYPNLGQVIFYADQVVYLYSGPGGAETQTFLPPDADGNGFDSYVVWECEYVGTELWLGLFVGDELKPAWVPFASIGGINPDYPFDPSVCK